MGVSWCTLIFFSSFHLFSIFCHILVCDIGLLVFAETTLIGIQILAQIHGYNIYFCYFLHIHLVIRSYRMVCASVREDKPRALVSGLSPVKTQTPYNNLLIVPACICTQ